MKEQTEIAYINKHKKQARQFDPNAMVVPAKRARAAIERAYIQGLCDAIDTIQHKKVEQ